MAEDVADIGGRSFVLGAWYETGRLNRPRSRAQPKQLAGYRPPKVRTRTAAGSVSVYSADVWAVLAGRRVGTP